MQSEIDLMNNSCFLEASDLEEDTGFIDSLSLSLSLASISFFTSAEMAFDWVGNTIFFCLTGLSLGDVIISFFFNSTFFSVFTGVGFALFCYSAAFSSALILRLRAFLVSFLTSSTGLGAGLTDATDEADDELETDLIAL